MEPGELDMARARGRYLESVEREYETLGAEVRALVDAARWDSASLLERQEICDAVHELMRTRIRLVAPTSLNFVSDEEMRSVVGAERAEEGLAYDELTGRIYVPRSHLTATPADALLSGLAHELRHAWQRDIAEGRLDHPLGDAERARLEKAFVDYDPFAPRWKMVNDPLEVDAEDARIPFGVGYQAAA